MILPTIRTNTTDKIFSVHFKYFLNDFRNENDCEIKINSIKIGDLRHRHELFFVDPEFAITEDNEEIIGEIETITVAETTIEIRVANLILKPEKLWVDFFSSFYQLCYKKWHYTSTEPDIDDSFHYSLISIERFITDKINTYGFNKEYYYSGEFLVSVDDSETEQRRKMLLSDLSRRLPSIEVDAELSVNDFGVRRKRGMSEWRIRRANLFKRIKDANPILSANEVADKATRITYDEICNQLMESNSELNTKIEDEKSVEIFENEYNHGKQEYFEDDVRNDYNTMGWKWRDSRKLH